MTYTFYTDGPGTSAKLSLVGLIKSLIYYSVTLLFSLWFCIQILSILSGIFIDNALVQTQGTLVNNYTYTRNAVKRSTDEVKQMAVIVWDVILSLLRVTLYGLQAVVDGSNRELNNYHPRDLTSTAQPHSTEM
ncbi:hypothetical protein [Beihai Nido-like virus 2]|uniref:Uncharacterized protein n=1 Tax=Beihai Nido-like virus 2 TaxID=1922351 RepID=A0A1L3KIS5_9NIDO|nr:hypothetical protein [Beihai Nido-like virus 2]APG77321.1 hypothetical protein [Beihai Nido-like virus 2]